MKDNYSATSLLCDMGVREAKLDPKWSPGEPISNSSRLKIKLAIALFN